MPVAHGKQVVDNLQPLGLGLGTLVVHAAQTHQGIEGQSGIVLEKGADLRHGPRSHDNEGLETFLAGLGDLVRELFLEGLEDLRGLFHPLRRPLSCEVRAAA